MTPIIIAVVTVAAIGLIAGIILTLASHFMAIKVDEKVVKVRECLPGANCGACGYAGCDEYAERLPAALQKPPSAFPAGRSAPP
ncbi:MAG: ferredoxin, partial [Oscillospiraceae bacterium]|nr:ferredoxin [Oscillospiraceae bacterium]